MKQNKRYDKSVFRALSMVLQFGINMLVPICMMTALGIFLDDKLDTSYWMVILFFAGAIAGGQNIYRMSKQIYEKSDERDRLRERSRKGANDRKVETDK